jgi:hypothetical protein
VYKIMVSPPYLLQSSCRIQYICDIGEVLDCMAEKADTLVLLVLQAMEYTSICLPLNEGKSRNSAGASF